METQLIQPRSPMAGSGVKLAAGIFLAALGLLLTLDNLDLLDAGRFLRYWPVLLIAVGLLKLREAGSRAMALILLVAGILLLGQETRWIRFSIFDFWPVILIGAGVVMVANALGFRLSDSSAAPGSTIWAVLRGPRLTGTARDFDGLRIIAFMGGCRLDLTDSEIEATTAVIEVIAVWGGITIRVPDGWEVVGQVTPIMGGIDIKTSAARGGRKLVVRGLTLMGGMEVRNAKARTA
jgi:hypothetical protein